MNTPSLRHDAGTRASEDLEIVEAATSSRRSLGMIGGEPVRRRLAPRRRSASEGGAAPIGAESLSSMGDPTSFEQFVMDWSLFFSAYAPMFAIAAIRWEGTTLKVWMSIAFALAALPMTCILISGGRQEPGEFVVLSINANADLNAGFLATYLLPFLTTDTPSRNALIAYGLFIWIVGLIFTRGRMGNVNPLLYLFRYHVAEVVTDKGRFNLVTRRLPGVGEKIDAARLLRGGLLLRIIKP